jgi:hypothetical protein
VSAATLKYKIKNPFRPGAGHMPPYLAGRENEKKEFSRLLQQDIILENLALTGLRGVGKTVLLETFKPLALQENWLWAGADLSESSSLTEESLAIRLLIDLSVVTSSIAVPLLPRPKVGFSQEYEFSSTTLNYTYLENLYHQIPGLVSDKLKGVLEAIWPALQAWSRRGIVFAYDEAQNLADHADKSQYPLSLLLDVFQSIQRKGIRFMLVLTGLPTLFPKLVDGRTFAERMFRVVSLNSLNEKETVEAIREPLKKSGSPFCFTDTDINLIWRSTRGYPYFVQYFCRETIDGWIQALRNDQNLPNIPINEIMRKLDSDFFAGRYAKATDRQRSLMEVITNLPKCDSEFTVQEIIEHPANKVLTKPFGNSHVSQMLFALSELGLIYKNRYGKYSFAIPLLGDFIRRQKAES